MTVIGGTQKAKTTNTFDTYKRLTKKTAAISSSSFVKNFSYGTTRVTAVADQVSGVNIGTNSYTYDDLGRIKSDSYTAQGMTEQYKRYTYDQYGQLVREDNQGLAKTFVYAYNDIGNLTSVKAYNYTQSTPSGSYTTTSFGYSADKLTSFGGSSISYNTMGCPTTYDGMSATWSKGKLSRLSSGTLASGTTNYTYSYNAFGQRVAKTYSYLAGTSGLNPVQAGDVTAYNKKYYYDHAGRLVAEEISKTVHGTGTVTEQIVFLYDESSVIGMEHTTGGVSTRYYFQKNLLGDVQAIVNTNGTVVARYLYDAFGNCTIASSTTNTAVANANPIRYRGYYYDDDTGLCYCNARYYSPKWRRFISPDDTAYLDPESVNGLNLYCYCNNDPVNYADPSGRLADWINTGMKIIAAAAILVATTLVITGTGGTAAVLFLGATCAGATGGYFNELAGGEFTSGYIGGFVSGAIQGAMGLLGPLGTVFGGSIGSGVGTFIAGALDNKWGSATVRKTTRELAKSAAQSAMVALGTSAVTGFMDYSVRLAVPTQANGLMPCLTETFGNMIVSFYGAIDDAMTYLLIMGAE